MPSSESCRNRISTGTKTQTDNEFSVFLSRGFLSKRFQRTTNARGTRRDSPNSANVVIVLLETNCLHSCNEGRNTRDENNDETLRDIILSSAKTRLVFFPRAGFAPDSLDRRAKFISWKHLSRSSCAYKTAHFRVLPE